MPKTTPRPVAPVDVTVSSPREPDAGARLPRLPYVPWVAAALLGSAGVVLLGWAVVGAIVGVAWLTAPHLGPTTVLDTISQAWLGVHGGAFTLGALNLNLTPLGLSALLGVAMAAVARFTVNQTEEDGRGSLSQVVLVATVCSGSFAVASWLVASLVGAPRQAVSVFVGALLIGGLGSTVGALRAARVDVFQRLPRWTRTLPAGVAGGVAGLTVASAATLALGYGAHAAQVAALHGGVAPDGVGSALLFAAYAAYLPNLLLWAGAYASGAGLTVGTGTLLTPTVSQLGLVPAIPIAGLLPAAPPVAGGAFWAVAPLAGVAAALLSCRRAGGLGLAPHPRPWALASGASGLIAAALWAAASWISRGDLGTGRLVGLGPRFPELIAALLPLAVTAALTGAIAAWWASRRPVVAEQPPFGLPAEDFERAADDEREHEGESEHEGERKPEGGAGRAAGRPFGLS